MLCRRRRSLLYIVLALIGSLCVYGFLLSRLPLEVGRGGEETALLLELEGERREGAGQRDILNIEQSRPVIVAKVESTSSELKDVESTTKSHGSHGPLTLGDGCAGPWPGYPSCATKMEWMELNWQSDKCYASYGVDGSRCSFQHYLSVVEKWCPPLRQTVGPKKPMRRATIVRDLQPLLDKMSDNSKFDWISRRIKSHWSNWQMALDRLEKMKSFNHSEKEVLIHIGALTDKAGFGFAENADHGGPLGELVQWSDLIAALHLLGHKLDFSTEVFQLSSYLEISHGIGGCPTSSETKYAAIYIDIVGLKQFKKLVKNRLQHYKCLFRVLDSFGTEPQFNFKQWKPTKKEYGRIWGNWELVPRQFMTMYPHTPDNSFLGFVVGNNISERLPPFPKKSIGLVYGKELYMWKDKRQYLDVLSRYIDIHATIGSTEQKQQDFDWSIVPGFVINHGILNGSALQHLLKVLSTSW